jgi:hypothetical protein
MPVDVIQPASMQTPMRGSRCLMRARTTAGIAVEGADAVVVDGDPDVVLLHQFLEVIEDLVVVGFDHDDPDAEELGELEQLAVVLLVEGRAGDAEGVDASNRRLRGRPSCAWSPAGGAFGIHVVPDHLKVFDPVLFGELDDLVEVQVAQGPGLDAELGGEIGGERRRGEQQGRGACQETSEGFHG